MDFNIVNKLYLNRRYLNEKENGKIYVYPSFAVIAILSHRVRKIVRKHIRRAVHRDILCSRSSVGQRFERGKGRKGKAENLHELYR